MALVFLDAVNETLKRVGSIQGDAGELVTGTGTDDEFTDSSRQRDIDLAVQIWQESLHELLSLGLFANEASTATITLVDGQREYTLATDKVFERFAGQTESTRVLRGATTGLIVTPYPGGYAQMLVDQPVATDYTGDPNRYAISPVTGDVRLDAEPTADNAGDTYNALIETVQALTSTMATETFLWTDTVTNALIPVVAETYNRTMKETFDAEQFRRSLTRAVSHARKDQRRTRWGIRRG